MGLLSVEQARERILSQLHPVTTESKKLADSANRVLGQDIVASRDLPPFDNSSMDGFAIRAEDVADTTDAHDEACAWSPTYQPEPPRQFPSHPVKPRAS